MKYLLALLLAACTTHPDGAPARHTPEPASACKGYGIDMICRHETQVARETYAHYVLATHSTFAQGAKHSRFDARFFSSTSDDWTQFGEELIPSGAVLKTLDGTTYWYWEE